MRSLIFLLSLAVALSGCSSTPAAPVAETRLSVVASFYPLAFLARSIGGVYAEVTNIVPAGSEPHEYEPTPLQLAKTHRAQVFLYHGAHLDPWAERIAPELVSRGTRVVQATEGMTLRTGAADGETGTSDAAGLDPHVWLDPVLLQGIASKVRDALIAADPVHSTAYAKNAMQLQQQLTDMDTAYRTGLAACRLRTVIVSHDAFEYLGARYGIVMLPIAGLAPDREPTAAHLAKLANMVRREKLPYVTFESLVSPKLAETIAREAGAGTLVLDPLEGLTPENEAQGATLLTLMQKNLETFKKALDCTDPLPHA